MRRVFLVVLIVAGNGVMKQARLTATIGKGRGESGSFMSNR